MECVVHADDLDRQDVDFVNTSRSDLRRDNEVVDGFIKAISDRMKDSLIGHSKYKGTWTEEQIMTLFSVRFGAKEGSATAAPATAKATPAPAVAAPAPIAAAPPTPTPAPAPTPAPVATKAATSAPADGASEAKAKKSRFSGKVVSADAASNTLVVHGKADQNFTVTSTTKITDASGSPATLAAAVAGTKVSGTYSKAGSTLTVYTPRSGSKPSPSRQLARPPVGKLA